MADDLFLGNIQGDDELFPVVGELVGVSLLVFPEVDQVAFDFAVELDHRALAGDQDPGDPVSAEADLFDLDGYAAPGIADGGYLGIRAAEIVDHCETGRG